MSNSICTTPMCDAGSASVTQMQAVFAGLDANGQSQFQSSVDAINASFNANYSWYSSFIPFNSDCCTIQDIGSQADSLTRSMQQYAGVTPSAGLGPGPGTSAAGMPVSSLVVLGVLGFLALSHVANKI